VNRVDIDQMVSKRHAEVESKPPEWLLQIAARKKAAAAALKALEDDRHVYDAYNPRQQMTFVFI
jgi:hypothetical protein